MENDRDFSLDGVEITSLHSVVERKKRTANIEFISFAT